MTGVKEGAALAAVLAFLGGAAQVSAQEPGAPGATAYQQHCSACHGVHLGGGSGPTTGPALKGAAFAAKWDKKSPADFLAFVHEKMPANQPGSLDGATSAAAANFVLGENHLPLGTALASSPSASAILEDLTLPGQGEDQDAIYAAALAARRDLLGRMTPVDDASLVAPSTQDWLAWRGASATQGFSKLDRIDRSNVARLALHWSLSLDSGTNAIAPVVHDGVMFVLSGGSVRALDAGTGSLLWKFTRPVPPGIALADQPHGIALYGTAVYVPTVDGHVVALDAKSGKLLWDREVASTAHKFWLTASPLAAHGKIIQGVSGCANTQAGGGCYIVALDAATGQEAWRFHTIPHPGEPGGDSWNGAAWDKRYGASVWNAGSYDPELNLIYFGVGQTYNISTLLDPQAHKGASADALFTDTTLAINPDTGKLAWYYQHAAEDVWDLDWSYERTLVTLDGQKVVITGGKLGIFDALDAKTGRYLWSYDFGLQNLVAKIDPTTGRKIYDPALMPEVDKHKFICPSIIGNRNWQTAAFDQAQNLLYVPITPTCMDFWRNDRNVLTLEHPGQMAIQMRRPKESDGNFGWLAALDVAHQKIVWTAKWRAPQSSAALATAGGLVFNGTRDRVLRALDSSTGKTLWEAGLPALPNAFPLTYLVDGKQYVAIVTGGGTAFDGYVQSLTPEDQPASNNKTIIVFALPEASP
ncbi:MAG: PQQ-binding-like beta-propeller repeat protein [Reyranella sp.]|nr:PQQ-binding-like beta-propeller repeat protein [Reyranella sp.]